MRHNGLGNGPDRMIGALAGWLGGAIAEAAATADVFDHPRAACTRALLDAIPLPDLDQLNRASRTCAASPRVTLPLAGISGIRQACTAW